MDPVHQKRSRGLPSLKMSKNSVIATVYHSYNSVGSVIVLDVIRG